MSERVCWVDTIGYEEATESLRAVFDTVVAPGKRVENLYRACSLRPHTIAPADALYRAVLHDAGNTLPKWFSELIGTYVAALCRCEYAWTHHRANFVYLLADETRAERILTAMPEGHFEALLAPREVHALAYVRKLTEQPQAIAEPDVAALRQAGWPDAEILEINQIAATFSYFVRLLNGLGVSLQGDTIGLYETDPACSSGDSDSDQISGKDG